MADETSTTGTVDGAADGAVAPAPSGNSTVANVEITVLEVEGDVQTDNVLLYIPKDALNVQTGSTVNGFIQPLAPDASLLVLGGSSTMLQFAVEEVQGDPDTGHQQLNVPKSAVQNAPFGTVLSALKYDLPSGPLLLIVLTLPQ